MALSSPLFTLQWRLNYWFKNIALLEKALVAGDSNSDDREGHRGLAQVGGSMMASVITCDGVERDLSRREIQDSCSYICSKEFCSRIARVLRLDEIVKPSERQKHIGLQPTTLKNSVAALVGAVWLDSHDYNVLLPVMSSIGLLNHAQYTDELQETLLMDAEFSSDFNDLGVSCTAIRSTEQDPIDGDYHSFFPEGDQHVESLFGAQLTSELCSLTDFASSITCDGEDSSPEYTPASSVADSRGQICELDASLSFDNTAGRNQSLSLLNRDVPEVSAQALHGQDRGKPLGRADKSVGRITKRSVRAPKATGRSRVDGTAAIIDTYVGDELRKDLDSQTKAGIVDVMQKYQITISQALPAYRMAMATMATSIGDSSALLLLKEALQKLRSSQDGDWLCIDRQMPVSERLQIIKHVGACSSLYRLVRWLHLVTLWEDLAHKVQDGSDRFVVATPDSIAHHSSRRGNPLNLARAEVAQGLSNSQATQHHEPQQESVQKNSRLRRLGQRLGLISRQWGKAALLILGQNFCESKMMTLTDKAFKEFITLSDKLEGTRISAISAAAYPILQDFCRGNQSAQRLRLEVIDDSTILSLPRLSIVFETLLQPDDEGGMLSTSAPNSPVL